MERAIIIGSKGQDGKILSSLLTGKGVEVCGIDKNNVHIPGQAVSPFSIFDEKDVIHIIRDQKPGEVYYLAAFHHSSEEKEDERILFDTSYTVHVKGLQLFLEAIRTYSPSSRLFYAASSHIFGDPMEYPQTENTAFQPDSVYGITKLDGLLTNRYYRNKFGLFTATGILYNHESQYRAHNFLSKKIITAAIRIASGDSEKLLIGDPDARTDWGYAPDYAEAMWRIMKAKTADEYIIATGILHSVKEFLNAAFSYFDLDWNDHVITGPSLLSRHNAPYTGSAEKLKRITGWSPSVSFDLMVRKIIETELLTLPWRKKG